MKHETAEVSNLATIGKDVDIWNWSQIREGTFVGNYTIIGKGVYLDRNVYVGENCKIQNNVSVYDGVVIQDNVFIGPHVCFTNDKNPSAVTVDNKLKTSSDWKKSRTYVANNVSIGANSTILPGIRLGEYSIVGAGSVVTKDVEAYTVVVGNPARVLRKVKEDG